MLSRSLRGWIGCMSEKNVAVEGQERSEKK